MSVCEYMDLYIDPCRKFTKSLKNVIMLYRELARMFEYYLYLATQITRDALSMIIIKLTPFNVAFYKLDKAYIITLIVTDQIL